MKLNIFTKSMIGMGLVCSSLPALAMEAWNNQQGGNKYQVIFDGKLIHPIAMDDGLRFAIREGGRTVGAGVVAKVLS